MSSGSRILVIAVSAAVLMLLLYVPAFLHPTLVDDDFPMLLGSWTWQSTVANLWVPANEHTMPLGRLSNWALVQLAGRPTALPRVAGLQGPLAVLVGMGLVYRFVRREVGDPWAGLAALTLFGVSSQYREAVTWFSASFAILALDTTLLALLAAQRWRQTGRRRWLLACGCGTALAPGWFASGILAGPLCSLYLLPLFEDHKDIRHHEDNRCPYGLWLAALLPLLGSGLFLAVSLPRNADRILHAEHYGDRDALQAFDLSTGLISTARTLVDNVLLGTFGISEVVCPAVLVPIVLIPLFVGAGWWWRRAAHRRLLLLGLGLIFSSYVLMYSARAAWPYAEQLAHWSRYHLFPHLGLVLFLVGGWPAEPIRPPRPWLVALLLGGLFLIQLPRNLWIPKDAALLQAELREIEALDERCRACGIDAATARALLPRAPWRHSRVSRWDYLRGSPEPRPLSVEEARKCLGLPPAENEH